MFGKLFGKHKLAPKVSPGKTREGLIGGLLTSAVISAVRPLCATERGADHPVGLFGARRAGFGAGRFDRKHVQTRSGYQDSGHLIPGHGGILDRIDSLTAAVPVFACLMLLVLIRR